MNKFIIIIVILGIIVIILNYLFPSTLRYAMKLYAWDYIANNIFHQSHSFGQQRAKALVKLYSSGMGGDDTAFDYYDNWGNDGEQQLIILSKDKHYKDYVFYFLVIYVSTGQGSTEAFNFCKEYVEGMKDDQMKDFYKERLGIK